MSIAVATGTVTATAAIKDAIEDVWTALSLDTALIFWTATTNQSQAGATWLRVTVDFGSSSADSWGGSGATNMQLGLIALQIFGPKNEGAGELRAIADAFKAALTRQTAGDVRFQNPFTGDGPRGPFKADSGPWSGQRLDVPFHYFEVM